MIHNLVYLNGKFCYNREPLPRMHYPTSLEDANSISIGEYEAALQHWKDSAREVVDQETARIATCDTERKKQNYNGANYWQWQPIEGHIYELELASEPEVL